jgi:hypothetical protein
MPLLLNKDQVVNVLDMKDCIGALDAAFTEMAEGTAVLPLRNNIAPPKGLNLYMPAYLEKMNAWLSDSGQDRSGQWPGHQVPGSLG